ncbi:MAG: PQQ-dependent sugar dehydrogenase [Anaerolineae bacterium]|nr:PQQ-dependent sugar dehydrogenase [Thermoflexales bacterium]MDW8407251.1 PQQ-dependent sugar dehydrogenase [Anaerolineae bacterium]
MRRDVLRGVLTASGVVTGMVVAAMIAGGPTLAGKTDDVARKTGNQSHSATTHAAPAIPATLPAFTLSLQTIVPSGLNNPVHVTHAGDGSGRLFIVEKPGRLRIVQNDILISAPFLTITDQVESVASERGLLSVAFDPDFESNGEFYLYYTTKALCCVGDVVIARYKVSNPAANTANVIAVTPILTIPQPASNHNGGQLQFGPDGFLYIATGDGGGGGDPWGSTGNGQNLSVLLGKVLRINPRGTITYTIPLSNPFLQTAGARPEIWAYGLRNPWRFSFDRLTGDLYIGDVGQDCWEEINFQPANSVGGENYGWRLNEGFHGFNTANYSDCDNPPAPNTTLPITAYGHTDGVAVTGGHVYRSTQHPLLSGIYFYGDYGSGNIWAIQRSGSAWVGALKMSGVTSLASFGEDEQGNLYVVQKNSATTGALKRLVMTPAVTTTPRAFLPLGTK